MRTYTCSVCKEIFESEWTDEEAISELADNFGTTDTSTCAVVCDACYRRLTQDAFDFQTLVDKHDGRTR